MYHKRRHNDTREAYENKDRGRHQSYEQNLQNAHKKYSKGMILLKSSVFAMFIVLVVLFAAYEIIKHRKNEENLASGVSSKCKKVQDIVISQGIQEIKVSDEVITIVTKLDVKNNQAIIRIDAACGLEINRITIKN